MQVRVEGKFESKYVYSVETNELLLRISDHEDKSEKFDFNTGEYFKPISPKYGTHIVKWQESDTETNLDQLYEEHNQCTKCEQKGYWVDENGQKTESEDNYVDWITPHCDDFNDEMNKMKNFYEINQEIIESVLEEYGLKNIQNINKNKIKMI